MPAPLAARMRPRSLEEIEGQRAALEALRPVLATGRLESLLLWGPPGCGKTTLARLLAAEAGLVLVELSAVMSGTKDLRAVLDAASTRRQWEAKGTLLFVDEIHRWNKAQQDALLPHVESGDIVLVGATTENPSFSIIPALRSRTRLLILEALGEGDLAALVERAHADAEHGLARHPSLLDPHATAAMAAWAGGDARRALALLERCAVAAAGGRIDAALVAEVAGRPDLAHDRDGDAHYDVVSAFIKSLRGSDPDAALYWMARMLEGGEDPLFVARRLVVFASEDVGNAEPRALQVAVAATQAVQLVGMPEGRIALGQACTFLATAPKSNASYVAIDRALELARTRGPLPVPVHLRNGSTGLARARGHGVAYQYPHDHPHGVVAQQHMPDALVGSTPLYTPTDRGAEKTIRERMAWVAARTRG